MPTTTGELLTRPASIDTVDGDGRTVTVRLVPYDQPRRVADRPGRPYVETWRRGGLVVDDARVLIEREHDGPLVGVLAGTEDRDDGLYGTIRVSRSSVGLDTLADIEAGILGHVSVDFFDDPVPAGGQVTRTNARLYRVAFTHDPALDAPIVSVRSNPTTQGDPAMPRTITDPDVDDRDDVDTDHDDGDRRHERSRRDDEPRRRRRDDDDRDDVDDRRRRRSRDEDLDDDDGDELDARRRRRSRDDRERPARHRREGATAATSRFESFGHFVRAAADGELGEWDGDEMMRYRRALTDVTTGDVGGLIQEQWSPEIIDLVRTYTPTIQAFRRAPLPTKGLQLNQPIVKTRPIVGPQGAEKTEIVSGPIEIDVANWAILTYAGGNDVSLQTIQRTEPAFLNEMMRLYMRELAQNMNAVAAATLLAQADDVNTTPLAWTGAETFDELLITASATFLSTYRRFAELVVLSVDAWVEIGEAKDTEGRPLFAGVNPANPLGSFSLKDGEGNVRQLQYWVDPELGGLGDGVVGVVGVRDAFVSAVGPVGTLTADVPSKIGRDIAVWQEAAFGAADAGGLMLIEEEEG